MMVVIEYSDQCYLRLLSFPNLSSDEYFHSKDVDGKKFTIRKCQPHAMEKVGTCEDVTHLEQDMKFCYCGTNECNGSIQLYPNSNFLSFIISTLLMLFGRNLV